MNPKISILCPSFNHEKYIKDFFSSVLVQTMQDFELIIVDDCSRDNNVCEIEKFTDGRIILIKNNYNRGINAALNTAFENSKGKYIMFIASDDILVDNNLQTICEFFDNNIDINIFYSRLRYITDTNEEIYLQEHKDINKYEVLEQIFLRSNCLPSPGMAMRRETFEQIYPLDMSLVQYQDVQMHVKLLFNNEMFFSKEKLVKYRLPTNKSGISNSNSPAVFQREQLETDKLMDSYLAINDPETLRRIFGDKALEFGEPTAETIPYILARLALTSNDESRKSWGYKTIMKFIENENNFQLLHEKYNFDFAKYINLVSYFPENKLNILDKKVKKYRKIVKIMIIIMFLILAIIVKLYMGG